MDMMQTERAKYWKEQVESWQSSGVKMRAWCKANEISEKNLSRWKRKIAIEAGGIQEIQKAPDGWCEVNTTPAKQILPSGIKLEINEQIRIELNHGFDHTLLREVVEALTR
jgi:hypothetical protein